MCDDGCSGQGGGKKQAAQHVSSQWRHAGTGANNQLAASGQQVLLRTHCLSTFNTARPSLSPHATIQACLNTNTQNTHSAIWSERMFSCRKTLLTSTVPGASPSGQYPLPLAHTITFTALCRSISGIWWWRRCDSEGGRVGVRVGVCGWTGWRCVCDGGSPLIDKVTTTTPQPEPTQEHQGSARRCWRTHLCAVEEGVLPVGNVGPKLILIPLLGKPIC